ncbi:phytanoyl-CoA dioxygenase family protein [Massilia forsythiae]|uniref:Phytanoyl-CoA dioxygenase family protein n=1 Tax=Massilia forsythiae TaxID=2728020 RepID=A0A7Z2W031_9BURK|nr:phytanoyl-CoA dioxygenase family protein [Massilia forsythiae]QJE02280.1 phytanoyl-CoA dioxygenase family protein [Massilia forsythiae]
MDMQDGRGGMDEAAIMGGLYGDGIVACKGAFAAPWVARLKQDIETLFAEAQRRPGGALERGPCRYYVEVHPERLSGFVDIVTHPWVTAVCRSVLGADYKIVEAGFDIPFPGAMHQPWHRDFAAPPETLAGRRLNSLAFNITTVDVTEEIGPFEIAPGTQWDDLAGGDPMFPAPALYPRYEARAQRKLPQVGDISARSALAIHRGTANRSSQSRPVFVLGVDAPDGRNAEKHDLQVTQGYWDGLPDEVRRHLRCRIVPELETIEQAHAIEGLRMGIAAP